MVRLAAILSLRLADWWGLRGRNQLPFFWVVKKSSTYNLCYENNRQILTKIIFVNALLQEFRREKIKLFYLFFAYIFISVGQHLFEVETNQSNG